MVTDEHRRIFCPKNDISSVGKKIVEKFSPIFYFLEWKISKFALFWGLIVKSFLFLDKNCQDFTLFGWKLSKNFLLSINIDKILFFLDGNCKNFPKKYKFGKNRGNFFTIFGPLGKYFYLHLILLSSSVNIFFISFFSKLNLLNY